MIRRGPPSPDMPEESRDLPQRHMRGSSSPFMAAGSAPVSPISTSAARHQQNVKLPRLHAMDDDRGYDQSSRRASTQSASRQRSLSSGSQQGMSAFTPFSPMTQASSSAGRGSYHISSQPAYRPSRIQVETYATPTCPTLPEPSRRSTMMDGSLPPLASVQSEYGGLSPRFSTQTSSKGSASARSAFSPSLAPSSSVPTSISASSHGSSGPRLVPRGLTSAANDRAEVVRASLHGGVSTVVETSDTMSLDAANRKSAKAHVSSACLNCKRAHLACDAERPCRRCTKLGKTATCVDVQHKKRGRPRLKDRGLSANLPLGETANSSAGLHPNWPQSTEHPGRPRSSSFYHGSSLPHPVHPQWGSTTGQQRSPSTADAPRILERELERRGSFTTSTAHAPGPRLVHNAPHLTSDTSSSKYSASMLTHSTARTVTLLCGTDTVAAHVSQECKNTFGLLPSQIYQRSASDLVHPDDIPRFDEVWNRLLQPVGIVPSRFPPDGLRMMRHESCSLLLPAKGTIFLEESVRMRLVGDVWARCSIRLHLGGAFGLDLYEPSTRDQAYVVCSICPFDAHCVHPDISLLGITAFPPTNWSSASFKTPTDSPPLYSNRRPSASWESPHSHVGGKNHEYKPHHREATGEDTGRAVNHVALPQAAEDPYHRHQTWPIGNHGASRLHVDIPNRLPRLAALHVSPVNAPGAPICGSGPPTSDLLQELAPTPSPQGSSASFKDALSATSQISNTEAKKASPSSPSDRPFSSAPPLPHPNRAGSGFHSFLPPAPPPFANARATVGVNRTVPMRRPLDSPPAMHQRKRPFVPSIRELDGPGVVPC